MPRSAAQRHPKRGLRDYRVSVEYRPMANQRGHHSAEFVKATSKKDAKDKVLKKIREEQARGTLTYAWARVDDVTEED
jgi:hypothetical protein